MNNTKKEIIKLKLTKKNTDGTLNRLGNIKLVGIDNNNKEHYLAFVTEQFAKELLDSSSRSEVINDTGTTHFDTRDKLERKIQNEIYDTELIPGRKIKSQEGYYNE